MPTSRDVLDPGSPSSSQAQRPTTAQREEKLTSEKLEKVGCATDALADPWS